MNKEDLKRLIEIGYKQWQDDPDNETIWKNTTSKLFEELSKDLQSTVDYINNCNANELFYVSQVFEELSEHFKSQRLIDCVERNITRFDNPKLQEQLKMELGYMKMHL